MSTPSTAPAASNATRAHRRRQRRPRQTTNNAPTTVAASVDNQANMSKQPCRLFLAGNCRFGARCRHSHEAVNSGIQHASGLAPQRNQEPFQRYGINIGHGSDPRSAVSATIAIDGGESIATAHQWRLDQPVLPAQKRNVCYDWKKGKCFRGSKCRFLHDAPSPLPTTPVSNVADQPQASSSTNPARSTSFVVDHAEALYREQEEQERNLKRLAEKAIINEREASVVTQHIVLKSSLVTCGSGMDVRGIVSGFDLAKVIIHNFPNSASPKDVTLLFTQQGLTESLLLVKNAFPPKAPGTKSYEVLLAKDEALTISAGLDGIDFGDAILKFEYNENTAFNTMQQNDEDRKDSIMVSWTKQAPDSGVSPDLIIQVMREYLTSLYGASLQEVKLLSKENAVKGLATARLSNATNVQSAVINLRNKRLRGDHPILRAFIPDPFQFSLAIPLPQYRAQKGLWDSLATDNSKDGTRIIITEDNRNERARIRVRGQDIKPIGALKVRIETLAAGERLESTLYHQSFTRPSGRTFLARIQTATGAFVRYDFRTNALRLYGDNGTKEAARRVISAEVDRLASLEWNITLQRQSVGFFIRRGLATLKEMLGEDAVSLNVASCQLALRGGDEARHALDMLLEQSNDPSALAFEADGEEICPICYDNVSSPFTLACDHVYCTACLRHYLVSATDSKQFPLICMGDEAKCKVPISIPVIQRFLTRQQYSHLVDVVFLSYLEQHPQEFRYCTTPDCEQIYRCNAGIALKCPSCFAEICSSCNQEGHEGMTCEERRRQQNQEEHQFDDPAWLNEHSIKRCPSCEFYIQKSEGCNHMTCRCGAHICWTCTQVFDEATEVYNHLRDQHGGIYDHDARRQNEDERLAAALQRQEHHLQQAPEPYAGLRFGDFGAPQVQVPVWGLAGVREAEERQREARRLEEDRRRAEEARRAAIWRNAVAENQEEERQREARRLAEVRRRTQEEAERRAAARRAEMAEYQRRVDERQRVMRAQAQARRESNSGWGCMIM